MRTLLRPFALMAGVSILLSACNQTAPSVQGDALAPGNPYANGVSYPWSYTAPASKLTTLSLTPGVNTLYYEPLLAARNGWGPIEINRSNGEQRAGDGKTITLNGKTYAKGFGVHAGSEMRYSLQGTGATCTTLTVDVGVDDEVGNRGSVTFQVFLDGVKTYDSGKMTGASATKTVKVNLTGARELRMIVTNGGDNIDYDHADWADPKITCQAIQNQPLTMTVSPSNVEIFHKHTATVKATFSGTFSGPVNLSLPLVSPLDGSVLTLQTSQVSLPASGTGTVTRDVVIEAPDLPASVYDLTLLTAQYRLVASQGGQERASAPLTVTEKLLTVSTSLTPSSFSGPVGATRRMTATVTVSPPLAQPIPIDLWGTTSSTTDTFTAVPVGAPYGDGGTMKQDFDLTLKALLLDTLTSASGEFYVVADSFSGYRLPYYGNAEKSLIWNVQP